MEGGDPELAHFYSSVTEHPRPLTQVDRQFTDFVLANEVEIITIGASRYTQTNECRRCVALLPAVMDASFESFHLVDIGTRAGLNLAIDRYRYRWDDLEWGPSGSLLLETELRGAAPHLRDIEVLTRTGLDFNPMIPAMSNRERGSGHSSGRSITNDGKRLRSALALLAGLPIEFVAGDALLTLGKMLGDLPEGEPAVVMKSFAINQLTVEVRRRIDEIVAAGRRTRSIHRISFELLPRSDAWTRLTVDDGSGLRETRQALRNGEWVELYARP